MNMIIDVHGKKHYPERIPAIPDASLRIFGSCLRIEIPSETFYRLGTAKIRQIVHETFGTEGVIWQDCEGSVVEIKIGSKGVDMQSIKALCPWADVFERGNYFKVVITGVIDKPVWLQIFREKFGSQHVWQ